MEKYITKGNLHLQEFNCTLSKGSIITLEDGHITCGALEAEVGNSFRIFVKGGMLEKIDEKYARILEGKAAKAAQTIKPKDKPKMAVVNGDENRIEIKPWEGQTDQQIVEADNGKKVDGMPVVERETVEIGKKVKDIPTETQEVQTKNGMTPRNKTKEKKDEEDVKKAAEAKKAERLAKGRELDEKAAAEAKKEAKAAKVEKADKKAEKTDVAEESHKIKIADPVEGVQNGKASNDGMATQAESIKIK